MTYVFGDKFNLGGAEGDGVRVISYDDQYDTYTVDVIRKTTDRFSYEGQVVSDIKVTEFSEYIKTADEVAAELFEIAKSLSEDEEGGNAGFDGAVEGDIVVNGVLIKGAPGVVTITGEANVKKALEEMGILKGESDSSVPAKSQGKASKSDSPAAKANVRGTLSDMGIL